MSEMATFLQIWRIAVVGTGADALRGTVVKSPRLVPSKEMVGSTTVALRAERLTSIVRTLSNW